MYSEDVSTKVETVTADLLVDVNICLFTRLPFMEWAAKRRSDEAEPVMKLINSLHWVASCVCMHEEESLIS